MPERAYSKRELDLKFASLEEKNDAWSASILQKLDTLDKDKITPIFEQSKYHNGRLKKLESWRWSLAGGFTILSLIVLPAFAYLARQVISNSGNIREVQATLTFITENLNRTPSRQP